MTRKCFAIFAIVSLLVTAWSGSAAAPANDNYANAIVLAGNEIYFTGTLAGATRETDPYEIVPPSLDNLPVTQTVWWTWSPTQSSTVVIEIFDLSKDTHGRDAFEVYNLEDIYTGHYVAGLQLDSRMPHLVFTFAAEAGTNYQFQLAGSDSAECAFKLTATDHPYIFEQPKTQTVSAGDSALLTVAAAGAKPFNYQWQFNGTNLPGETAPILMLDNVNADQAGCYAVAISNAAGETVSHKADLFVTVGDTSATFNVLPSQSTSDFRFSLLGETGRRYRISSSTNLTDWAAEASFSTAFHDANFQLSPKSVIFNSTGADSFTLPCANPQKFFRASCFHAVNEVCNNHLKAIRFAQLLLAYDDPPNPYDGSPAVTVSALRPFLKNGDFPACPSGRSVSILTISANPVCSLHPFEER